MKQARILIMANSRSTVGRDYIAALKLQFMPSKQIAARECSSMISEKLVKAVKICEVHVIEQSQVEDAFSEFFERLEGKKDRKIEPEFNDYAKFTQKKGWRISFKVQDWVQKEIECSLVENHIEKVFIGTVNDKKFIQPTVTTLREENIEDSAPGVQELNKSCLETNTKRRIWSD